jgi:hypothetical protein
MKRLFTFLAALLLSVSANAQFVNGQVLTAPALNSALANPVITGGSINGVNIGAITAGTGKFTGLNATSIGAVTPGTGVFTTLSASTPMGVTSGGTGLGTLTAHGVLIGEGTAAIAPTAVGTTGQMLLGVTGADPAFGNNPTITGGTIDNAVIGGTTKAAGSFTTIVATGTITPSSTNGIVGTTTNDSSNAGSVGEYVTANASAVSVSSGVAANVTSISLTAGDWDVTGQIVAVPAGSTVLSQVSVAINTASAVIPAITSGLGVTILTGTLGTGTNPAVSPMVTRISLASTTTVFLVTQISFSVSTCTVNGFIRARRVR